MHIYIYTQTNLNIKRCPDINSLMVHIKLEQNNTERALTLFRTGHVCPPSKQQLKRESAICDHVSAFKSSNIADFLDIMSVITSQDKEIITPDQEAQIESAINSVLAN
jgi:hypothetical protein